MVLIYANDLINGMNEELFPNLNHQNQTQVFFCIVFYSTQKYKSLGHEVIKFVGHAKISIAYGFGNEVLIMTIVCRNLVFVFFIYILI